jgi:hypothetical protein
LCGNIFELFVTGPVPCRLRKKGELSEQDGSRGDKGFKIKSEGKIMTKKFLVCLSLLCVFTAVTWAAAAAPTNFAGTWELDKAKSEGLPRNMENADSVVLTITQTDKQVTVETKVSGGAQQMPAQTLSYNLDGSETTAEMGGRMPGKATLKAKWMNEGKTLELQSVRNISAQGQEFTVTSKEHWELADGGKVLKLHRTTESPQGTRESKLTFNKK